MKHRKMKSILLSFALGLALYAAVLPGAKPAPTDPVPTTSPAPSETERSTSGDSKGSVQPLKDLDEKGSE